MIQHFTKDNFQKEVIEASKEKPVLVDFFATWCGPCQTQAPILEELDKEMEGKVIIGKVDTEEEGELSQEYGIMSIPTLIIFRNGEEKEKIIGLQSQGNLKVMLVKNMG